MTQFSGETRCARHQGEATRLRCGRCNDPICPRCLVQSPVGARCPKCAVIGRPTLVIATARDLLQAFGAAVVIGAAQGAIIAYILSFLFSFVSLGILGLLLIAALFFLTGTISGITVKWAGRYKIDFRLRYIAALAVLTSYTVAIFVGNILNINWMVFVTFLPLIGFALGVLTAMKRAR